MIDDPGPRPIISIAECGHPHGEPSPDEIDRCPEIIVRICLQCHRGLWWDCGKWRIV